MHTKSVRKPRGGKRGSVRQRGRERDRERGREADSTHTCTHKLKKYLFYIQQNQHISVEFGIPSPLALQKQRNTPRPGHGTQIRPGRRSMRRRRCLWRLSGTRARRLEQPYSAALWRPVLKFQPERAEQGRRRMDWRKRACANVEAMCM